MREIMWSFLSLFNYVYEVASGIIYWDRIGRIASKYNWKSLTLNFHQSNIDNVLFLLDIYNRILLGICWFIFWIFFK